MTFHPIHNVFDKAPPTAEQKREFLRIRHVEGAYRTRMRKIADYIDDILKSFSPTSPAYAARVSQTLNAYANVLDPWARSTAERMVVEVEAADKRAWHAASRKIGLGLRSEIDSSPVGAAMRESMARQVTLITSLPTKAAEQVHQLTLAGISESRRASSLADDIAKLGDMTRSRALLIARTEVRRTGTELTKARALSVGSTTFKWHTAGDTDVRESHKKLNGQVFRWDDPPITDPPDHRALPGCIWNCRCWAEPIIDDED